MQERLYGCLHEIGPSSTPESGSAYLPFKKAGQASVVARIHRCIHAWIPEGLKNWGGKLKCGGHNLPVPVEIGLTVLSKAGSGIPVI